MESPWVGKKEIPLKDLDRWNTEDKGYLPKRHIFNINHPETYPEVECDYFVCFVDDENNHHWAVRYWDGNMFLLFTMDIGYKLVAWIRTPPAPMEFKHYLEK